MKFLKENWSNILLVLFLLVVGVLLLINPEVYGNAIIRVIGIISIALGIWSILKYFHAEPEEAAKGYDFFSGSLLITVGIFCLTSLGWFERAFPLPTVIYGVLQVLFGFLKLQRTMDEVRAKSPIWWMQAVSAAISLIFGFIIALNTQMGSMSIWTFTGFTMIIEGVVDCLTMIFAAQKNSEPKAEA